MKYLWITDPHFDSLGEAKFLRYLEHLKLKNPDGIFITGDVSTGNQVAIHLSMMSEALSCPIYFVLGNHDFYRSNFATVENSMLLLMQQKKNLFHLNLCEPIALNKDTCLIGHDGWYDARWRIPFTPVIFIWDYYFIKDFSKFSLRKILELVRYKADLAAQIVESKLRVALEKYSTVYLLTHFPPWPEKETGLWGVVEKFWAPYNASKIMAETIERVMAEYPKKHVVVTAGHTHVVRHEMIAHNIELRVGKAERGIPQIQDVLEI